ncbi:MAG: type II secretion system F family protein, partial [Acidobacteriaceae bacterium]
MSVQLKEDLINLMNPSPETQYIFVMSSVFAGLAFFLSGFYLSFVRPMGRNEMNKRLWGNSRKGLVEARLFKIHGESRAGVLLLMLKAVLGWAKVENLQRTLYQADIFCSPEAFLGVAGILGCAGYLAGSFLAVFYWRILLAGLLGAAPYLYLRIKRKRKASRLERQMPEGMDLLSRSLRAGHTLQSAMEMASAEIGSPLGVEMKIAFEEQRLGLSLNKALHRMSDRVASQDLRFFVTAVSIQSETGGNLAEVLENIGKLIRARLQLRGKIQGLTAEGRFSALILAMLPVGIFLILYFVNPGYIMLLLTDTTGNRLLMGGVVNMLIGILWMSK